MTPIFFTEGQLGANQALPNDVRGCNTTFPNPNACSAHELFAESQFTFGQTHPTPTFSSQMRSSWGQSKRSQTMPGDIVKHPKACSAHYVVAEH
jgi:hypothetical protein